MTRSKGDPSAPMQFPSDGRQGGSRAGGSGHGFVGNGVHRLPWSLQRLPRTGMSVYEPSGAGAEECKAAVHAGPVFPCSSSRGDPVPRLRQGVDTFWVPGISLRADKSH